MGSSKTKSVLYIVRQRWKCGETPLIKATQYLHLKPSLAKKGECSLSALGNFFLSGIHTLAISKQDFHPFWMEKDMLVDWATCLHWAVGSRRVLFQASTLQISFAWQVPVCLSQLHRVVITWTFSVSCLVCTAERDRKEQCVSWCGRLWSMPSTWNTQYSQCRLRSLK